MNRVLCVVIIALLVACGALSLGLNHYRDNAITYKEQRDKATSTIADMQKRQRDVAELDARYRRRAVVVYGITVPEPVHWRLQLSW